MCLLILSYSASRGEGEGGEGNFLYMAEYGCACRMAPFFSVAKYMIGPFFQQNVYNWPHFSGLVYESLVGGLVGGGFFNLFSTKSI